MAGKYITYGLEIAGPYMILLVGSSYAVIAWGLFRLHNWARWLAVAWMAFHVAISYPVLREIAVHALFLAAIVWLLFQSRAGQYFASKGKDRN